ncbi:MAG: serine--tRNA ligase [Bacteroidales bacterium]|nr:serine--tRNA ligase [Bacteroidales bacterium]
MLQLKFLLENKDIVVSRLKIKNFNAENIIEEIETLNNKRKKVQTELNKLQEETNKNARLIGTLVKENKTKEVETLKLNLTNIKEKIQILEKELKNIEKDINDKILQIPNIPHLSVPAGKGSTDNIIIKTGGPEPKPNNLLPHWELGKKYKIIDFEAGVKITGGGFPVYVEKGAKLQRALVSYFLDKAIEQGFKEYIPPYLVNENTAFGTGQLPDKEGQMYKIEEDNLYLIPTAEVPLTNIYKNTILNEDELPIKLTAYTPCFRREAGSYGQNVRGLNRIHQFDKVEIVVIEHPDRSYKQLEDMVSYVESIVISLNLPYRIVKLCGGDLSFTSALTYDIEVFSMAQNQWLEVSSISNFETFQANRMNLKYKDKKTGKNFLCHTLNGSALALPRIVAAILENNQFEGGIKIPEILIPYTGFSIID